MGFPTKHQHFGVFWGYPYFWKHPFFFDSWCDEAIAATCNIFRAETLVKLHKVVAHRRTVQRSLKVFTNP